MANEDGPFRTNEAAAAWERFCEELKRAGDVLLRDTTPQDDLTQAEGLRYLARHLHIGFENAYELADPHDPRIFEMVNPHKLYEGVTGDCRYHHAYFDGNATHRVRGLRGDSPLIEIGVYTGKGGFHAGSVQTGGITEEELIVDEGGRFELVLGPKEHAGNWIQTGPDDRYVMIREYAADWSGLAPGRFEIEKQGAPASKAPTDLKRVIAGLEGTRDWMINAPPRWAAISDFWLPLAPNEFVPELPKNDVIDIGVPKGHQFGVCCMKLEPGEAMVVIFRPEPVPYWSLSLVNYWYEPLAFREYTGARQTATAFTNATAAFGDDGSVRAVIADCPPEGPNWLDTRGHLECTVLFRISRSKSPVPPLDVEIVPLKELRSRTRRLPSARESG
jgi:hypothetical protein